MKKGCWCVRGHPAIGGRVPLSIPPQTMEQGLFGDLSVQVVTLLTPCLLPYPNVATELTHIQISFSCFIIHLYHTVSFPVMVGKGIEKKEIQTRAWLISGVFGHLIWISLPWHVSMCWYTTPVTFLSLGPLASFKNFLLFWTVKSWDYIDFTALLSKVITDGNSMFWCSGCILILFAERFDFPIKRV